MKTSSHRSRRRLIREDVFKRIHDTLQQSPLWESMTSGNADSDSRQAAWEAYNLLSSDAHRIESLSLAVVRNAELLDHSWLIAHHPDAGYFMIDPTASQFLRPVAGGRYDDVFIGTYLELEKMMSREGGYSIEYHIPMEMVWSPVMRFEDHYQVEERNPWKSYGLPVLAAELTEREAEHEAVRLGRWAARMEEQGADWRKLLAVYHNQEIWPDPGKRRQVALHEKIRQERNLSIRIDAEDEARLFQDDIGSYREPRGRRRNWHGHGNNGNGDGKGNNGLG